MLREQGQDCQVASERLRGWWDWRPASQPGSSGVWLHELEERESGFFACLGEVWPGPNSKRSNFSFSLVFIVLCCCVVFLPNMLPPNPRHFSFPAQSTKLHAAVWLTSKPAELQRPFLFSSLFSSGQLLRFTAWDVFLLNSKKSARSEQTSSPVDFKTWSAF